jgi:hypothetical protein
MREISFQQHTSKEKPGEITSRATKCNLARALATADDDELTTISKKF